MKKTFAFFLAVASCSTLPLAEDHAARKLTARRAEQAVTGVRRS
jgi:hypothetical protein